MPAPSSSDRGFTVTIDPGKTANFYRELRAFDPALTRALRASIRNAGVLAQNAVIQALKQASPTGKPFSDDTQRAALVAATKVSMSFAQNTAGAKIVTGNPSVVIDDKHSHGGFAFAYNMASFRHPVYETDDQTTARHFFSGSENRRKKLLRGRELAPWVSQRGNPFFGAAINKIISTTIQVEVESAFDVAAKASGIASPF